MEPTGLLQVSGDVDPDYREGSELTYLHRVAVEDGTETPRDLDVIDLGAGKWVVFRTSGPHPGPSIVAILERADDFSSATCELWFPVERA